MSSEISSAPYRIYLLTVWFEEGERQSGKQARRFSLEDPLTGERHGFADSDSFLGYLQENLIEQGDD